MKNEAIVLKFNGKRKKIDSKKLSKKKEDKLILLKRTHKYLGKIFRLTTVHEFINADKKIDSIKFSYDFIDDYSGLESLSPQYTRYIAASHKITTNDINTYYDEVDKIEFVENILNDSFWIFGNSEYYYTNLKLVLNLTNGKQKKYKYDLKEFYNDFYTRLDYPEVIMFIGNNKYKFAKYSDINNIVKIDKYRDTVFYANIYSDIYIQINPNIIKDIKSAAIRCKACADGDYYFSDFTKNIDNTNIKYMIEDILESYKFKEVMQSIIAMDGYIFDSHISVKSKLKSINNEKTNHSLKYIIKKYFKSVYKYNIKK